MVYICICMYGSMDGYVSTLSVFVVCSVGRGPLMGWPSAQKV